MIKALNQASDNYKISLDPVFSKKIKIISMTLNNNGLTELSPTLEYPDGEIYDEPYKTTLLNVISRYDKLCKVNIIYWDKEDDSINIKNLCYGRIHCDNLSFNHIISCGDQVKYWHKEDMSTILCYNLEMI